MLVRVVTFGVEIWTPAKLNLFLEVLSKRPDGFHELDTLMTPIHLFDTLYFQEVAHERIEFDCRWASPAARPAACQHIELPTGNENIVVRALELLRKVRGIELGAKVRLIKRIPLAAGLAGGSSDAAAALVAANRVWHLGMSRQELADVAARIGSDVPFFLQEGAALCRGRGEQIEPLFNMPPLHLVVVYPPAGLATADVFRICRPVEPAVRPSELVQAWQTGNIQTAGQLLHNRLQVAAAKLSPWIDSLEREFARQDVLGARMSGSGTSYFGLCRNAVHARRVAARLRARGIGHVYATHTCRGLLTNVAVAA